MYKNVLVTLDGSNLAESVFPHVETVVKGCMQPTVTLLRVVEPIGIPFRVANEETSYEQIKKLIKEADDKEKEEAAAYLKKVSESGKLAGAIVSTKVLYGQAADSIVDYAAKNNMDLIIMATHGRSGISRWIQGSVADRVLRSACRPILLVQAPGCGLALKK